jgi:hypothetical protein
MGRGGGPELGDACRRGKGDRQQTEGRKSRRVGGELERRGVAER